ncbi:TolC family protein [Tistrella bauzanensis]|nr:TolC family protein [Tistrella bauzanensis]
MEGTRHGRRIGRSAVAAVLAAALLAGCAVTPEPIAPQATEARISADLARMFSNQEPLSGRLSLHEAMARAILYNLDGRLRTMEQALSQRQLDLSRWDMLPSLAASAGFVGRDNVSASSSENVATGSQSLVPSTSTERNRRVADLNMSWNILDFGVSYVTAQQNADRSLIAAEQRRRVVHTIIQDVRSAYWRAVAAERVLTRIDPLMARIEQALASAAEIERQQLRAPADALTYRRGLLDALRQLQAQRRELRLAKTELAALINIRPGEDFSLEAPETQGAMPPVTSDPADLERLALANRPEVRELDYQTRISQQETRKALLRLLPGIELDLGAHYDSNKYLVNNDWADYGVKLTWNLLNILRIPGAMAVAEANEDVVDARRMAISMAVLAQVHVAQTNYEEARRQYETARELSELDNRILDQARAAAGTRVGDLQVIQTELAAVQTELRRDLAFADANNAFGRLFLSIGADPLPEGLSAPTVSTLATAIGTTEAAWRAGRPTFAPVPDAVDKPELAATE